MSLDLAFDDAQQAIVDGIAQFCRDRCPDSKMSLICSGNSRLIGAPSSV